MYAPKVGTCTYVALKSTIHTLVSASKISFGRLNYLPVVGPALPCLVLQCPALSCVPTVTYKVPMYLTNLLGRGYLSR